MKKALIVFFLSQTFCLYSQIKVPNVFKYYPSMGSSKQLGYGVDVLDLKAVKNSVFTELSLKNAFHQGLYPYAQSTYKLTYLENQEDVLDLMNIDAYGKFSFGPFSVEDQFSKLKEKKTSSKSIRLAMSVDVDYGREYLTPGLLELKEEVKNAVLISKDQFGTHFVQSFSKKQVLIVIIELNTYGEITTDELKNEFTTSLNLGVISGEIKVKINKILQKSTQNNKLSIDVYNLGKNYDFSGLTNVINEKNCVSLDSIKVMLERYTKKSLSVSNSVISDFEIGDYKIFNKSDNNSNLDLNSEKGKAVYEAMNLYSKLTSIEYSIKRYHNNPLFQKVANKSIKTDFENYSKDLRTYNRYLKKLMRNFSLDEHCEEVDCIDSIYHLPEIDQKYEDFGSFEQKVLDYMEQLEHIFADNPYNLASSFYSIEGGDRPFTLTMNSYGLVSSGNKDDYKILSTLNIDTNSIYVYFDVKFLVPTSSPFPNKNALSIYLAQRKDANYFLPRSPLDLSNDFMIASIGGQDYRGVKLDDIYHDGNKTEFKQVSVSIKFKLNEYFDSFHPDLWYMSIGGPSDIIKESNIQMLITDFSLKYTNQ